MGRWPWGPAAKYTTAPSSTQSSIAPPHAGDKFKVVIDKREGDKLGMRFAEDLVDGFMLLKAVAPGSLAEHYGMQAGDLIESINGTSFTDSESAVKVLRESQGGLEIMLTRRRRGSSCGFV
ncbi:hypothetical protein T492DRAFT_1084221 [Pavlovales sp. CCMP2436]|nr:hypothetical protein T492DRAFT_1084221 [Pavlovales sp. CCMP2436]